MRRILIVGTGDIALRVAPLLAGPCRVFGLVRRLDKCGVLRAAGVVPLAGDLDCVAALSRIGGLADTVLHFAPPPNSGNEDARTRHLLAALTRGPLPKRLVYISTSGVYGDCAGALVKETRALHPHTERARRRVDAERRIRAWAARNGVHASILRVPGIYSAERLPVDRLRSGTPVMLAAEDSYSNHIHADDLARIVLAALRHGRPNRIYHASDDSEMKMGDYFDAVADAFGLPHPPRLSRADAERATAPTLWSFMSESRRLDNTRLKRELGVTLRYPSVTALLNPAPPDPRRAR